VACCKNLVVETIQPLKIAQPEPARFLIDRSSVDQIRRRNNYRLIKQIPAEHVPRGFLMRCDDYFVMTIAVNG
jgi:hypothetical protein